jgi:hypothetical protein
MRDNSGKGDNSNNRGNPALEEREQARGRSGEAITSAKKSNPSGGHKTHDVDRSSP